MLTVAITIIVATLEDIHISYVGKFYRALEEVSIPHMEQFIYRWRVMQAGVITPVLLWLLSSNVAEHQLDKSLRALESHQETYGMSYEHYGS